jgi:hypothetical protein
MEICNNLRAGKSLGNHKNLKKVAESKEGRCDTDPLSVGLLGGLWVKHQDKCAGLWPRGDDLPTRKADVGYKFEWNLYPFLRFYDSG